MSVLLETSLGDLVVDLFYERCPKACFNFLRLCLLKKLNGRLINSVQKDFIAKIETQEDRSVFDDQFFKDEPTSKKFNKKGLLAMANNGPDKNGSNFFITLTD